MRTSLLTVVSLALSFLVALAEPEQIVKDDICEPLDNATDKVKHALEGVSRERACKLEYWDTFKTKPAKELLDKLEHELYLADLRARKCRLASLRLIKVFAIHHPRAPDILEHDDHRRSWKVHTVPKAHPAVAYCFEMNRLSKARAEIKVFGLKPKRFTEPIEAFAPYRTLKQRIVQQRNNAIHSLTLMTRANYLPAAITLARLSHKGEVLKFNDEFQYYYLGRLKAIGIKADDLGSMIDTSKKNLTPTKIKRLNEQVRKGKYVGKLPLRE